MNTIAKKRKADEPLQITFLKALQEPPQEEQSKTRIMGWWQNAMSTEVADEVDFHDDDIPLEPRMLLMERPEPQQKESYLATLLCKSISDQSAITIQFTNQSEDCLVRVRVSERSYQCAALSTNFLVCSIFSTHPPPVALQI